MYFPQDHVQRPRETRYQFTPAKGDKSFTQELCIKLYLDPRKVTPQSPAPQGTDSLVSSPLLPRNQSSPQLSGVWANRSHVIRPPLTPTTSVEPLGMPRPPTTPTKSVMRQLSPSPDSSVKEKPPAKLQGAWSKPGSGVAAVRSRGQSTPSQPPVSQDMRGVWPVGVTRTLQHSVSGPVGGRETGRNSRNRRRVVSASETHFEQQRSHDQQQGSHDPQRGLWQGSSGKDRTKGERSYSDKRRYHNSRNVPAIVEGQEWDEGAGIQRSYSTTQAHQPQAQEGGGASSRKPFSEPI